MDDLDALAALYRDPEIRRYFPEGTLTHEETKEELEWIINVYYGQHGFGLWATIHKETNAFIGRCGLLPWTIDGRKEIEVAYLLDKAYWGQGLATEVAQAIVRYAFEQLHMSRLICLPEPENHASIRVAEKMGMTLEREFMLGGTPAMLYSVSKQGEIMTIRANGEFDVKLNPLAGYDTAVGRLSIDKQFHGDLEATSKGEMLAVGTDIEGSAGYVAMERVSGTLHGRSGTFALQHNGIANRGAQQLTVTVVPDSGTGQLVGLAGAMAIIIADGKHSYDFEYTLSEIP